MSTLPSAIWRAGAAAALLALSAGAAQARVDFSIGLNLPIGMPYGSYYATPAYGSVYGGLPAGAVSVQIGGGHYWHHRGSYYRPWGPSWMVVAPPVVLPLVQAPPPPPEPPPLPTAPRRPDPVIYPRDGQSAAQTEFDRQECNRWATTQPAALAEASVFHRAVEACMDGRGYTMK